ncbi:hypothetical protein [Kribbella sp. NPDC049584]|uniref:hypothetical protein n=1 Tax=Kribbella sp. NPDC049584 TaxID=3154833 RepID=UPI003417E140
MQYIPFSMIKSIHEQTHSAMPGAPLRPYVPKRHPIRDAVRRWRERRTPAPRPVELTLIASPAAPCEAEVRDRGTTPTGVARAG